MDILTLKYVWYSYEYHFIIQIGIKYYIHHIHNFISTYVGMCHYLEVNDKNSCPFCLLSLYGELEITLC